MQILSFVVHSLRSTRTICPGLAFVGQLESRLIYGYGDVSLRKTQPTL